MKNRILLIVALLALGTDVMAQFLHVQSKEIVDANGQPVLLRGIGLGGWLVPEGYMLHIPGYGSPTSIRTMIADLLGEDDTRLFYERYRANYVTEMDIALIASWGFNSIRLPFHYEILSPKDQPGVFLEEGFQILDSLITWSKRNGMYVILDMHCAPGGQNADNISDSDGEAKLWTVPANQDRTIEVWKKIAERYANEPWVAAYDLLNEPVMPSGFTNIDLRNFYRKLASAIREVDTNHILFIEGNTYATDFRDLAPPLLYGTNVAYSFHKYWSETSKETIQDYLNLRSNHNVPLWLGESGENSNPWFYETVKLMEENSIGWCWWTHKKIQTTTSLLSSPIGEKYQRVLDYWNGRASRPTKEFAREALFEMADNLAWEKCQSRPDVWHALFDSGFANQAKPYATHVIPGVIPCVAFDFGNAGLAYQDQDYKRVRWDIFQPWNSGSEFRNDGVDIEKSQDENGHPFSIGWINAGEWVKYTIYVNQAGFYDVVLRVASLSGGGALKLILDGQELASEVLIPSTSGWYNWTSKLVQDLGFPSGEHTLVLQFTRSGFNLNQMEFIFKRPLGVDDSRVGSIQRDYELFQNYPNPFSGAPSKGTRPLQKEPSTTSSYSLADDVRISLKIFNAAGQEVRELVNEMQNRGEYSVVWDGRDDEGMEAEAGIYFYTLQVGHERRTRRMVLVR